MEKFIFNVLLPIILAVCALVWVHFTSKEIERLCAIIDSHADEINKLRADLDAHKQTKSIYHGEPANALEAAARIADGPSS